MNDEFDKAAWARAEDRKTSEVSRKLQEILPTTPKSFDTVVEFTCPRGHSFRRWRASVDHHDTVILEPLPGQPPKRALTSHARRSAAATVCSEPGCSNRVDGVGFCQEHGGRSELVIYPTSTTTFECSCWRDDLPYSRILKLYGEAAVLGINAIPLTGAVRRAPRRRK
ncbi:MAG: hypothetical protein JWP56_2708 [Aeromicrobium sp.]|nr:hypothetical protein [Aeromicrobium sp.]